MRIFMLGATGTIGAAVARELTAGDHRVAGLSRSRQSDAKLGRAGVEPVRGELEEPGRWIGEALDHDAIIHAAGTFTADEGLLNARLVDALLAAPEPGHAPIRLLFTGGCWLYGETGEEVATEERPFDPVPAFAWMVEQSRRLLASERFSTAVVHPAMVYHGEGGVFRRFLASARSGERLEIWGTAEARWPLVHRDDLARAYRALVESPALSGDFNVAAEAGVRVGEIAREISGRLGAGLEPVVLETRAIVAAHGDWAVGPTLVQRLSAGKLSRLTGWSPRFTDYRKSDVFPS